MALDRRAPFERRLRNHLLHAPTGAGTVDDRRVTPAADTVHSDDAFRARAATRLAGPVGGEVRATVHGTLVWIENPPGILPIDRGRLASLPGGPPLDVPLLCLDTETTGLGTAAGTLAFLVGIGWWVGGTFRQVQLMLPDHADEPALLDALETLIPADGWLVTYNGRGFDWPLLVTRFRMSRRPPPPHAGHLDLLSLVRRVYRHRLPDARLGTVERDVLGLGRHGDVEGWQIPARYLGFLRSGDPGALCDVVRHNAEDVRSLARLLAHAADSLVEPVARRSLHPGDLLGLARAYRREARLHEALACLDAVDWDAVRALARPDRNLSTFPQVDRQTLDSAAAERARLLRRTGRKEDALRCWEELGSDGGRLAGVAWIEVAKCLEHDRRDVRGALAATERARAIAERSRGLGRPLPLLEADVARRRHRLQRRLMAARSGR